MCGPEDWAKEIAVTAEEKWPEVICSLSFIVLGILIFLDVYCLLTISVHFVVHITILPGASL